MRPTEVSEAVTIYAAANVPVMLWGQPGAGKSDIVRNFAQANAGKYINPVTGKKERKVFDVRLALLDPTDLRGIPYYDPESKTARWGQSTILPMMGLEEDEDAVLFLDEINSAPPVIQAAAYQLVLDRKVGEYELPKGVTIIAAGNRQSDKGVTFQMPTPLQNRFAHIDFEVNNEDWINYAVGAGIHPAIVGFIDFKKDMLNKFDSRGKSTAFATPRAWAFLDRVLRAAETAGTKETMVRKLAEGIVGEGAAIEFMSYRKSAEKLPNPDMILDGTLKKLPDNVKQDLSIHFALVTSLVAALKQRFDDVNGNIKDPKFAKAGGNFLTFTSRELKDELALFGLRTAMRTHKIMIAMLPEFRSEVNPKFQKVLSMVG